MANTAPNSNEKIRKSRFKSSQTLNLQTLIENPTDIVYLQVNGQNQLEKEYREIKGLKKAYLDREAIHRNEITKETEERTHICGPNGFKTGKEEIFAIDHIKSI